ncbi:MAG: hypothetical protein SCJ93_12455, partial [Bacillota bacterium]|nr:hypothetical protein [Bacillota bacterium]
MKNMQNLNLEIHSLVIFRSILNDNVIKNLIRLVSTQEKNTLEKIENYSEFTSSLFSKTTNLSKYFL